MSHQCLMYFGLNFSMSCGAGAGDGGVDHVGGDQTGAGAAHLIKFGCLM